VAACVLQLLSGCLGAGPPDTRSAEVTVVVRNASAESSDVTIEEATFREFVAEGCEEERLTFRPSGPWVLSVDGEPLIDSRHGTAPSTLVVEIAPGGAVSVILGDTTPAPSRLC